MWPSFAGQYAQRTPPHLLAEWMDGDCSYEDFRDCLRSLQEVNRAFRGYRPTLQWLSELPVQNGWHIVDIGSGGGDLLREIRTWTTASRLAVRLTGVDLNPCASQAAKEFTDPVMGIEWITGDALAYTPERPVHVIVSALTMHHLEETEIITLLRWMEQNANAGWFINDLRRSRTISGLFWVAAVLRRWHRFVRHDGPVSFRRAFREEDWQRLLEQAGVDPDACSIQRCSPGRLCVGRKKR